LDVLLLGTVGLDDVRYAANLRGSRVTVERKAMTSQYSAHVGRNATETKHLEVPIRIIGFNDCTN
jgi:hypothetical protein